MMHPFVIHPSQADTHCLWQIRVENLVTDAEYFFLAFNKKWKFLQLPF